MIVFFQKSNDHVNAFSEFKQEGENQKKIYILYPMKTYYNVVVLDINNLNLCSVIHIHSEILRCGVKAYLKVKEQNI